jgi:alditol oxidase
MSEPVANWAGNVRFGARAVRRPGSVDEVREIVARADRVRALGTAHSFSTVADTAGELVSLAGLPAEPVLDGAAATVSVPAGMRYGELARWLHARGLALHNLGSLPHISVAGACATGTHGSGVRNGSLATAVVGLEVVTAGGGLRTDPDLAASVVGLGALGVVTRVTLSVRPAYEVRQYVFEGLPWPALATHVLDILAAAYSVSVFTDWADPPVSQVWVKLLAGEPVPELFGARPAAGPRHPIAGHPAGSCTAQLGEPGPWHHRLPHFRLEFTPSSGAELQSEYLIPSESAPAALAALREVAPDIARVLQVCELRAVAADGLWLSPSYRRDSVCVHFTWVADTAAVRPVLALVESRLAPFAPRPHWGKLFTLDPATVRAAYPRAADFQRLRHAVDATNKFGNEFVDRYLPALPRPAPP